MVFNGRVPTWQKRFAKLNQVKHACSVSVDLDESKNCIYIKVRAKEKAKEKHSIPFLYDFQNRNKFHKHCQSASENINTVNCSSILCMIVNFHVNYQMGLYSLLCRINKLSSIIKPASKDKKIE